MKAISFSLFLLCLAAIGAPAQSPSADQVMADARAKAVAEKKTIFVHFGASWCGWCKRLEKFIEAPEIKPVFEKYFVPVKLVLNESEPNKKLENAGAGALLVKLGGANTGVPFSAFLDAKGEMIINSFRPAGDNIGHPFQPEEIDYFIVMMKKAAPTISSDDVKAIEAWLRKQAK